MSAGRLLGAASVVAALGCGGGNTGPGSASGANGEFAGTFFDHGGVVAVSLRENHGVVTGFGWSNINYPLEFGVTITGTYAEPDLHFDLEPRVAGDRWHFNGTLVRDTLRGEYAVIVGKGFQMELVRTDVVPAGGYTLTIEGSGPGSRTGLAYFVFPGPDFNFTIQTESADTPTVTTTLYGRSRDRPLKGTYTIGATGLFNVIMTRRRPTDELRYQVSDGTLTIDRSGRFGVEGSYVLHAVDPSTGAAFTARGRFSAGCSGQHC